ncbi:MAG TPA: hypothetical protein VF178_16945 [Gemmatimonadaceae bacterium]
MTVLTRIKLALALIGVVIFAAGVRFEDPRLRYIGLGFVAVAWVLRFVRSKRAEPDAEP